MARGRDDDRPVEGRPERPARDVSVRVRELDPRAHDDRDPPFARHLTLPRQEAPVRITSGDRTYRLNQDDVRTLATIGTFRVVPVREVASPDDPVLRALRDQGLVRVITRREKASEGDARVAVLTPEGQALLDTHAPVDVRDAQTYYAGLVKPNELDHDAQLYALYRTVAADLADEGLAVTRVQLDYEIKAAYQAFLHRPDRPADATLEDDRAAFADAHDFTIVDGAIQIPDLRLTVESPDGDVSVRDLELVTEHYAARHVAAKRQAGFTCYRAGGGRRLRAGRVTRGGRPDAPSRRERLS